MSFYLGPNALAAGYRLFAHDSIGSTSVEAMRFAEQGDEGQLWIAAREQTAGVGRRGRAWLTPHGNLAASVLSVTHVPLEKAATLGFAAGLSLIEGLGRVAPALDISTALDGSEGAKSRLMLKWPNDVLANGAKIAGILLQAEPVGDGMVAVVAGIGVNITIAPHGLDQATVSMAELGVKTTPEEVLAELAESWLQYERLWDHGIGLPEIRDRWLRHASGVGGEVSVTTDGEIVRGRFETIDDHGCLVIMDRNGGRRRIAAGEVHFGAVASLGAAG